MTRIILNDFKCEYNGETVKWFIGDLNYFEAKRLGFAQKDGSIRNIYNTKNGFYWMGWGRGVTTNKSYHAYCSRYQQPIHRNLFTRLWYFILKKKMPIQEIFTIEI